MTRDARTTEERLQDALSRLQDYKARGNGQYVGLCPCHDDNHYSLSIGIGHIGKILVYCFADTNCDWRRIYDALGLIYYEDAPVHNGKLIEKAYDYMDASGELLFQVVRFIPKDFRQRRPDGRGGWVWNLKELSPDEKQTLYRLPDLLAKPDRPVCICGGEKDCDNLAAIGVLATTNAGGEGNWRHRHSEQLKDRNLVILPDNDEKGRRHEADIRKHSKGLAKSIVTVNLPCLPEKGDVTVWLEAGGTKEKLIELIKNAAEQSPAEGDNADRERALTIGGQEVLDAVRRKIAEKERKPVFQTGFDLEATPGHLVVIGGNPGSGKSTFGLQCVFDALENEPDLRVIIASVELPPEVCIEKQIARLSRIPFNKIRYRDVDPGPKLDEAYRILEDTTPRIRFLRPPFSVRRVATAAADFEAKLVLIDYLQRFTPTDNFDGDTRRMVNESMSMIRSDLCDKEVAVLAVSSLNRVSHGNGKSAKARDQDPDLSMFRESSEIEYGVDDAYYLMERDERHRVMVHLKSRYSAKRNFVMEFVGWRAEFILQEEGRPDGKSPF